MVNPTATSVVTELKSPTPIPIPVPVVETNDSLWSALTTDTGCAVLVYNTQGRILSANSAAQKLLGISGTGSMRGKSLADCVPAPIAEERLAYAQKVLQSASPIIMDGMLNGRMTRATLRAMPDDAGTDRILETIRPIAATEPKPEGVAYFRAKMDDEGVIGKLTAREREVLIHIGQGLSTAAIAAALGRSTKTVEWHRVSLGTKLQITNRVQLARIALRAGLTGLDS